MNVRHWVVSLALGSLWLLAFAVYVQDADAKSVDEQIFRVTSDDNSLVITLGEQQIATYYIRHDEVDRPFFAHLCTPSGVHVTRNFPPIEGTDPTDHPTMHPGVWLAFANINGVNFWHNNDGKVLHDGFEEPVRAGATVRFTTREHYVDADGQSVCRSTSRYQIARTPNGWMLKIESSIQSDRDLVFRVKEEMGLGVRVATPISVRGGNGSILNGSGDKDEQGTWGKHDRWWDYSGVINEHHVGILLLSDASNPPIWSHSRDYGLLVANPFPVDRKENQGRQTVVPKGQVFQLRFTIAVYEASEQSLADDRAISREIVEHIEREQGSDEE